MNANDERRAVLLTVREAARLAGVSVSTIRRWVAQGRIPSVKIDNRVHIRRADIEATVVRLEDPDD